MIISSYWLAGIGSGGMFAQAAAMALFDQELTADEASLFFEILCFIIGIIVTMVVLVIAQ